jgi:hypothetical protein
MPRTHSCAFALRVIAACRRVALGASIAALTDSPTPCVMRMSPLRRLAMSEFTACRCPSDDAAACVPNSPALNGRSAAA